MDIRLSKIFRELLVKIPQSASKWMSILKKSQGVACENGSKCTKMDIRFSKISRELLVKIPQST
jgi:hypothetical protein